MLSKEINLFLFKNNYLYSSSSFTTLHLFSSISINDLLELINFELMIFFNNEDSSLYTNSSFESFELFSTFKLVLLNASNSSI